MCEMCQQEEENVVHFLGRCPAFRDERLRSLGRYELTEVDIHSANMSDIVRFAISTGRFDR